ncbi:MAG: TetR/AcrR family transcriptional regulator [bacterium]
MAKGAEQRREQTRAKILSAAGRLFSRKGYHNTQVMDICHEARISAGTFYLYFQNKRDLFEHIARETLEDVRTNLKRLRQPRASGDLRERMQRIRDTYTTYFDYIEANPEQLLMVLRGSYGIDEDMDGAAWRYLTRFADDIAEDFQSWQKLGVLRKCNPAVLGHMVNGMTLQVAHSYIVEKKFTREEALETLVEVSTAMLRYYLTAKGRRLLG